MAIARVEAKTGTASGTTIAAAAFVTPTTAGETVIARVCANQSITALTDDLGQTYVKLFEYFDGIAFFTSFWYLLSSAAGATTVTATIAAGSKGGIVASHYTSLGLVLDVFDGAPSAPSASPWASDGITTTVANALLLGTCFGRFGTVNSNIAATGGWTQLPQLTTSGAFDGNNGHAFAAADQIVAAIQTGIQNTGTNASSGNNWAGVAAFKEVATAMHTGPFTANTEMDVEVISEVALVAGGGNSIGLKIGINL